MGRPKAYRQRLGYQVRTAGQKTLARQLVVALERELGMAEAEAELLGARLDRYVQQQPGLRAPGQIVLEARAGPAGFGRRPGPTRRIRLTVIAPEDLEVAGEFGLAAMQTGRLLRWIEEAQAQDALLSARQLGALAHLTPTALRRRLGRLRALGLWVPVAGLSRSERARGGVSRSNWLLARWAEAGSFAAARAAVGCSRTRWSEIRARHEAGQQAPASDSTGEPWTGLAEELARDYGFPPVRVRAVRELLEQALAELTCERPDGDLITWAVAADEPAGKPLSACRLVPVQIPYWREEDLETGSARRDLNRVRDLKRARILRFTTAAKQQGGYLTYADLFYLLGIHSEAIRGLIEAPPPLVAPLRGMECDIGRGVTHRAKIVRLYLEMHTETEIVARTGHSYEAVESYLRDFATVFVLSERGMPPPLIRRVTNRSMKLVEAYLDLIARYHTPEYAFRFQQLRHMHARQERKKGAPLAGAER